MKVAIVGPGRSGTSLLVKLFQGWGFSVPESMWFEAANAGGESKLDPDSLWEINKDPWAYQYLQDIDLSKFDHVIIPLRDMREAASSRVAQELFSRLDKFDENAWKTRHVGAAPGGIIYDISTSAMSEVLSAGLWQLCLELARQGVGPILLHFPRFAEDFTYVRSQLGQIYKDRISEEGAKEVWEEICSKDKIRVLGENSKLSDRELELETLVNILKGELKKGDSLGERQDAFALIEQLSSERRRWHAIRSEHEAQLISQVNGVERLQSQLASAIEENERRAKAQIEQEKDTAARLMQANVVTQRENEALSRELLEIKNSRTWRWSAPLRRFPLNFGTKEPG